MGRYKIYTFGCQMNIHESEKMAGVFQELGYSCTDKDEDADIILFNTCCVRENAENHIIGNVGALKPLKKKNKDLIICVGGCFTQQNGMAEKLKSLFPFIDIIFGTFNSKNLKDFLEIRINANKKTIQIIDDDGKINEDVNPLRSSYPNAWVNIMYGCNNFCTYCIVPYVRGRERSREMSVIIEEVKSLVENGYKEITLLGQNVDSYGKDLPNGENFTTLLREVDNIDGDFRIRFMSNHPKDINEELVKLIAKSKKICNYIHLPVQSGSSRVLKLMNRKYTRENYLSLVKMIRSYIPDCSISTDIMVGFPTETEEDFLESMSLLEEVKFDGAFTFVYSPRNGTIAAKMDGQIPDDIKKDRIMRMVELQNNINIAKSKDYVDKVVEILCEDYDKKKDMYLGRDERNRMVYFKSPINPIGQLCNVKVKENGGISLYGDLVK